MGLTLENVGIIFDDNSVRITVLKTTDNYGFYRKRTLEMSYVHVVHTGLLLPILS